MHVLGYSRINLWRVKKYNKNLITATDYIKKPAFGTFLLHQV